MKNSIKRILAVLVALTLVFAMVTGMSASADEAEMKLPTLPDGVEIIDGEIYSFREVLENVTLGLDHAAMDEVYFDGYQWNVTTRQNFTDGPWGIKDTWWARETPLKDQFAVICASGATGDNNSEIWNQHEMMIEWNVADPTDKKVYWSLQPLWSCSSNVWINFVAPHTGKIVLFEEYGAQITACSEDAPFWSFQQDKNRPWKITVEKNDVKIWPMEEDCVVLDKNNRAVDFPSLGKTGVMPVTEGDIISIRIDIAGEFESKFESSEYNGTYIGGMTTATFNPVVAYTEIEEPVPEVEDTFDDVDDDVNTNDDGDDNGLGWLLYVIIGAGVLVVAAVVAVVIIVVAKKKKAVVPADEIPEAEATEDNAE